MRDFFNSGFRQASSLTQVVIVVLALSGCASPIRCFSWAGPLWPRLLLGGVIKSVSVRILVIEDEVKLATHLSRALEAEGHEARVVHYGKVALVEARDGNYDLLVLDVELPRVDGFEILKQLRSSGVDPNPDVDCPK